MWLGQAKVLINMSSLSSTRADVTNKVRRWDHCSRHKCSLCFVKNDDTNQQVRARVWIQVWLPPELISPRHVLFRVFTAGRQPTARTGAFRPDVLGTGAAKALRASLLKPILTADNLCSRKSRDQVGEAPALRREDKAPCGPAIREEEDCPGQNRPWRSPRRLRGAVSPGQRLLGVVLVLQEFAVMLGHEFEEDYKDGKEDFVVGISKARPLKQCSLFLNAWCMSSSSKGRSAPKGGHCQLWGSLTAPLSTPAKELDEILSPAARTEAANCSQYVRDDRRHRQKGAVDSHSWGLWVKVTFKGKGQGTLKSHPSGWVKTSAVFLSIHRFVSHQKNHAHGHLFNPESNPNICVLFDYLSKTAKDVQIPSFIQLTAVTCTYWWGTNESKKDS